MTALLLAWAAAMLLAIVVGLTGRALRWRRMSPFSRRTWGGFLAYVLWPPNVITVVIEIDGSKVAEAVLAEIRKRDGMKWA